MTLGLYAHPADLRQRQTAQLAEWGRQGVSEVAIAASYHAGRWLLPQPGAGLVRFLEDGIVHFPPTAEYGAIVPQPGKDMGAGSPLAEAAAAATAAGLRAVAWLVLFHNTRLGEKHGQWTVQNVFGDHYPYALCPAQEQVQRYGTTLVSEVAKIQGLQAVELEAAGFFGYKHGSHHDKSSYALDRDTDFLLSYCFCDACQSGLRTQGVDVEVLMQRVRQVLHQAIVEGDAMSPDFTPCRLPDSIGSANLDAMLKHRLAVQRAFLQQVRAMLPNSMQLLLQVQADSLFTGSAMGQDPRALADLVHGFVHTHYGEASSAIANTWSALPAVTQPRWLAIWPKAPQFGTVAELARLQEVARAHQANLRVYHAGLLPQRSLRRVLESLATLVLWLCLGLSLPAQATAPASRPRLVVLLSVDQLAPWVLAQALPFCGEDGFRRLLREGVSFAACSHRHACSETGPGHATLSTGATARGHGIIGNSWSDPVTGKSVCCVADEHAILGGGEEESKTGRGPGLLLAPTLGDCLKAHFGNAAKVASVSWKDRSAILMAGHAADLVLWVDGGEGRYASSTAYGKELPAWVTQRNEAGVMRDLFGMVWDRCAGPEAYAGLVDDLPFEGKSPAGERTLPQKVTGGLDQPGARFYGHVYLSPFANDVVMRAAQGAVTEMALGADDIPDLLCIGFSANDAVGHQYGPHSVEVRDITLRTDRHVAGLLDLLDQRVGKGKYLFLLSADHGIAPTPEFAKGARVRAERAKTLTAFLHAMAAAEKTMIDRYGPGPGKLVRPTATGSLLFARELLVAKKVDLADARRMVAVALRKVPGVARAITLDEAMAADALADPVLLAVRYATHPDRSADIELVAAPFWIPGTTPATHGSAYAYDREVPMLILGPGIASGRTVYHDVGAGVGAVIAAHCLGMPKPPMAEEQLPAEAFAGR